VRDAALLLDALVGYDPDDPSTATTAGSHNVGNYIDRQSLGDLHGVPASAYCARFLVIQPILASAL
jgi:Asp-tRNA(Asn)/Glu-tRNA(Gln) amidotransferase A subunit family amidase